MSKGGSNKIEETQEEIELARVSADKWNDYVTRYIPFENEFISRIEVTEQEHQNLKGTVAANTNKAFGNARTNELNTEKQLGVKPGSGRFNGALERVLKKQGRSLGYRATDADNSMNQRRVEGLQAAINIGRGKEAQALKGMSELASQANDDAMSDAEVDATRREGNNSAIGIGLGAAGRISQDDGG